MIFLKYDFKTDVDSKRKHGVSKVERKAYIIFSKKKKFNVYVVNSENKLFTENDWHKSHTYAIGNQSKKIMSDNHVRKYSKMSKKGKKNKKDILFGVFKFRLNPNFISLINFFISNFYQ